MIPPPPPGCSRSPRQLQPHARQPTVSRSRPTPGSRTAAHSSTPPPVLPAARPRSLLPRGAARRGRWIRAAHTALVCGEARHRRGAEIGPAARAPPGPPRPSPTPPAVRRGPATGTALHSALLRAARPAAGSVRRGRAGRGARPQRRTARQRDVNGGSAGSARSAPRSPAREDAEQVDEWQQQEPGARVQLHRAAAGR